MRSLLSIPRELRDLIYLHVLVSELPPPSSPWAARRRQGLSRKQAEDETYDERGNFYPLRPIFSTAYGLLLVCRQFHTEVQGIIALLEANTPLRYKIDCMLDYDFYIYPTWLSVPYLSSHVDTVDVDMRVFGASFDEDPERRLCSGTLGSLSHQLWKMLDRFLVRGPDPWAPKTGSKLKVRVINVNMVPTSECDDLRIEPSATPREGHDTRGLSHFRNLPSLQSFCSRINEGLLYLTRPQCAKNESIIECVDYINISVNGKLKNTWDLTREECRANQPSTTEYMSVLASSS
jgi:hypothetical protein